MSTDDGAGNGRPGKTSASAATNRRQSLQPPNGEPRNSYQRTLAALRASPHCRRISTSSPTQVWMLSSPEQLAAFKRALSR